MLHLAKNQIVTDISVNHVEIRQLEVDWYCSNYSTMTGQAAMLAGFAFSQLTTPFPDDHEPSLPMEFTYLFLVCLVIGLELSSIILSSALSVWAPSLALKGKGGASDLHKAVDCLRDYQHLVFWYFVIGWIIMFISNILLVWIYFRKKVAVIVTIPLSLFIVAIVWYTISITYKLRIDDNEAVKGKIDQLQSYEFIGDLDHGLHTEGPMQQGGDGTTAGKSDMYCSIHETLGTNFKPKLGGHAGSVALAQGPGRSTSIPAARDMSW